MTRSVLFLARLSALLTERVRNEITPANRSSVLEPALGPLGAWGMWL